MAGLLVFSSLGAEGCRESFVDSAVAPTRSAATASSSPKHIFRTEGATPGLFLHGPSGPLGAAKAVTDSLSSDTLRECRETFEVVRGLVL